MENMAWFKEYVTANQPDGRWNAAADCAVRVCLSLEDEMAKQHVIAWADSLIAADSCTPACGKALFAALAATGDEKYREAIEGVMTDVGREPLDVIDSAEAMYAVLPFRMAYEMKLGGMEKVGKVAAQFRAAHKALWDAQSGLFGGSVKATAYALLALVDAIDTCADQLYEHWRAMVDIYREVLRGALAAEFAADEAGAMLVYATLEGVRMNLIDPERYLPMAEKRIAALKAAGCGNAAAMLEMKGGAL